MNPVDPSAGGDSLDAHAQIIDSGSPNRRSPNVWI